MKAIYSKPKIYKGTGKNKEWYIWWRYNKKLFIKRDDINRIKDLKERLLEAEAISNYYFNKLRSGWNPLVPDLEAIEGLDLTLSDALDFAMDKKKSRLSHKTYLDYQCTIRFCKDAIRTLNLGKLLVVDTKRVHIKTIMETMMKQRKWSNLSYNKNLNYLQAVLSELLQWDIIPINPGHNIKHLQVNEYISNVPATPEEHKIIKEHLETFHVDFGRFVQTLFYTGIRPVELTRIQISYVDMINRIITLPGSITKSRKERTVPINNSLYEIFESMNIFSYPGEYYLFGSFREKGKGNIGSHKDFICGPTQLKRDTATNRWRKIVKIGLGINVNLYSTKKSGANAYIMAGASIRAIKELFGHTSEMTTEIYITNLKDVLKKDILANSPIY
jgi:integrase